jgi:hypothetical protein
MMTKKFKQLLACSAIACACFTNILAADTQDADQMYNSTSTDTPFRNITPNAGPRVDNGIDVFISADFTYWTARQEGLAYARSGVDDFDSAVAFNNTVEGSTSFPHAKFSPGFKAGIGLNLGHDGWDVYLNYTWFHTNQHNSRSSRHANSQGLVPLWDVGTVGHVTAKDHFIVLNSYLTVNTASSNWQLHFNNFDLDLGRNFYISQYLTLRPHAGLKGCWYHQKYTVRYSGYLDPDIAETVLHTKLYMQQSFWGVGVRTGIDTCWYFDKNWSMFGNTSLAALWGRFSNHRYDYVTLAPASRPSTLNVINTKFDFHSVKPVLELQLGLRYDYWFSDDRYHFGIAAAWEEQVWFNQSQFFDVGVSYAHPGDLIFQGLTLDIRFDF